MALCKASYFSVSETNCKIAKLSNCELGKIQPSVYGKIYDMFYDQPANNLC